MFNFAFLGLLQHLDGISKFIEYIYFFVMAKKSPPVLGKSQILDD